MSIIQVLSQHVADLIAAGEVVERPASVAKELVENAIDAGATFITVEIRSGGIAYLRVTDDGIGIAREDVPTAILRHSTSKIRDEEDLASIGTLGFRGEALAAITAVSKLEIKTRRNNDKIGTRLYQEGGKVISVEDAGCPKGTTIIVRELFYNTPARMKFLKKDASEGAAVESIVTAIALSHPNISFQLIREGKTTLHTPGDGKEQSCVYSVLGRDIANSMLYTEGSREAVSVKGFVTKPIAARGNRALQYFYVNGRYVKSKMLMAALEQAYDNLIMKGRYPSCVLKISLPLELCDVNVHPTKTEVKFAREKDVFDAVYYSVKSALSEDNSLNEAPLPVKKEPLPFKESKPMEYKQEEIKAEPIKKAPSFTFKPTFTERKVEAPVKQETVSYEIPSVVHEKAPVMSFFSPEASPSAKKEEVKAEEKVDEFKFIGEVLNTYIILECGEDVVLIDKHAAHERILFEKLKREDRTAQAQLLISSVYVDLPEEEIELLDENKELITKLGFEIDRAGHAKVAVRQVPDGIDEADVAATVSEVVSAIASKRRMSAEERMDEILHSIACKAAIKAGMKSSPLELTKLAREVMSRGDIRYCPHGRPVAVTLTKYQLERMFRRS